MTLQIPHPSKCAEKAAQTLKGFNSRSTPFAGADIAAIASQSVSKALMGSPGAPSLRKGRGRGLIRAAYRARVFDGVRYGVGRGWVAQGWAA